MPTPAATILNTTATGDAVTGPGCPLNLVNGLPVACMGDTVAGPVCTGAITVSTAVYAPREGTPHGQHRLGCLRSQSGDRRAGRDGPGCLSEYQQDCLSRARRRPWN